MYVKSICYGGACHQDMATIVEQFQLEGEYDIPIEKVITHQAVTGKHCPHDILDRYGYDNFLNLVRSYLK